MRLAVSTTPRQVLGGTQETGLLQSMLEQAARLAEYDFLADLLRSRLQTKQECSMVLLLIGSLSVHSRPKCEKNNRCVSLGAPRQKINTM